MYRGAVFVLPHLPAGSEPSVSWSSTLGTTSSRWTSTSTGASRRGRTSLTTAGLNRPTGCVWPTDVLPQWNNYLNTWKAYNHYDLHVHLYSNLGRDSCLSGSTKIWLLSSLTANINFLLSHTLPNSLTKLRNCDSDSITVGVSHASSSWRTINFKWFRTSVLTFLPCVLSLTSVTNPSMYMLNNYEEIPYSCLSLKLTPKKLNYLHAFLCS